MEALRKLHNGYKRQLIQKWVRPGSIVLDCGCGRGGDWHKWKAVRAHVSAIDPDPASLAEAESRAREMGFPVQFLGTGDIRQVADAYDVVCYNFSLHYIFADPQTYKESLDAIRRTVKPGGLLMGITPERARAEMLTGGGQFKDPLGNTLEIKEDRLWVGLTDGPFYADGAKSEPLLDAFDLTHALASRGFSRLVWEPMLPVPNGHVSDLYSAFVFKKI
jgi:ubiquinone/menaquinone biosynthesis C-methylase UbiE